MKKFFFILFIIFFNNSFCINIIPGDNICEQELNYIKNRQDIVNASIQQLIDQNTQDSKLPTIAICFSGGGYRAMITSAGFLSGAEETNLIHATSYMSALSGSTWLLIPLLTKNIEMTNYKKILKKEVNTNFWKDKIKNISLIDFWSQTISEHLLSKFKPGTTFETIRENLTKSNQYPFPLFSCLITNSEDGKKNKLPYDYLEISPFTTYGKALNASVDTQYLGSVFENGKITQSQPELPESFFMGMLGSPFCISIGDILSFSLTDIGEFFNAKNYHYLDISEKLFNYWGLFNDRITPAKIPNYTYSYEGSKLSNLENLELADSGINILNLAIDPLFRRIIDILIICDSSADATNKSYPELRLAANFAKDNNINFPEIIETNIIVNLANLKVFYDQNNTKAPAIVYITNPIKESTLKLQYNSQEFDDLYNTMHNLVSDNKQILIDVIKLKIKQLN